MKILIYDSQFAYYELIKSNFSEKNEFILYNPENSELFDKEYDMLMFFLYDELELLSFMKLYKDSVPVLLGLSQMNKVNDSKLEGNIYYLHLDKLKNEIINDVQNILDKVYVS